MSLSDEHTVENSISACCLPSLSTGRLQRQSQEELWKCQKAIDAAKSWLSSPGRPYVLISLYPQSWLGTPLLMEGGVGGGAGGAVLSQRLPDGGERPGAHMSRRLTALRIVQAGEGPVSYSGWRSRSPRVTTRKGAHLGN
ncbi:hypothetical protein HJG60_008052 [Phyllostomus discolor]|uniref:Uncharacterized protein n=1 Tax=Phyllostomus discolor TaxID=89673 RepID=A0A834EYH3_9CHIR|nr:hypothetical protein HJG60_008052 [Phyllostomus discolor]